MSIKKFVGDIIEKIFPFIWVPALIVSLLHAWFGVFSPSVFMISAPVGFFTIILWIIVFQKRHPNAECAGM